MNINRSPILPTGFEYLSDILAEHIYDCSYEEAKQLKEQLGATPYHLGAAWTGIFEAYFQKEIKAEEASQ